MLRLLRLRRPPRLFSALVAACYFFISVAISFQHTNHLMEEAETVLAVCGPGISAQAPIPIQTQLVATSAQPSAHHCAACEWQSVNLSAALPAITLAVAPPAAPRAITVFPRYLRLRLFSTPSRAPPLV